MTDAHNEQRPDLTTLSTSQAFRRWYFLKSELVEFCKAKGIPATGNKIEVSDRIASYLDSGQIPKAAPKKRGSSKFNWAKSELTLETIITDSVTFGKNFRGFMTTQIGSQFVCHSDFMDWVRAHSGKTLADAVEAWHALEARKLDPTFKRDIAPQNMLAQYTRDYFEDNPNGSREELMRLWNIKKSLPNEKGVIYHPSDLGLI